MGPYFSHAVHFLPAKAILLVLLILRNRIHRKVNVKCFDSPSNSTVQVFRKKFISGIHLLGAYSKMEAPAPGDSDLHLHSALFTYQSGQSEETA